MRQKKKTPKEILQEWALVNGWKEDRHGHFKKTKDSGVTYRLKMQSTSVRYEKKVVFEDGRSAWWKIRSGYYKNIRLTEDGKISGLS